MTTHNHASAQTRSSSASGTALERALEATRWLLPLGLGGGALGVQLTAGGEPALSVIAGLAGLSLGIFLHLFLQSLASLLGRAPLPLTSAEARAHLERDKRIVLRSLKDLELDVALGRLDDAEAKDLALPLRERAMRILRELDQAKVAAGQEQNPLRVEIERAAALRLEALLAAQRATKAEQAAAQRPGVQEPEEQDHETPGGDA